MDHWPGLVDDDSSEASTHGLRVQSAYVLTVSECLFTEFNPFFTVFEGSPAVLKCPLIGYGTFFTEFEGPLTLTDALWKSLRLLSQ